jgi:hypothetical protein
VAKDKEMAVKAGEGAFASGETKFMKAYRNGRPMSLPLDPRVDLTKPIYEQVLKLEEQDCTVDKKRRSAAA